ncbi:MAG: c-type cytochrome [Hyphomicrobiaceae bacterium]
MAESIQNNRAPKPNPRIVAFFAAPLLLAGSSALAADIQRGKSISEEHCSRCHVVGDFNPTGGISSTPSFQLLVKRRPDYRERFQTFHSRRPHPAFVIIEGVERLMPELPVNAEPIRLPIEAVDDIVAFVETLKQKQ